jgi:hypothetical protein
MDIRSLVRRLRERREWAEEEEERLNAYRDEFLAMLSRRTEANDAAGEEPYLAGVEATAEFREKRPEVSDELMNRIIAAANRKGLC